MMNQRQYNFRSAFTILELMIVIGILVLLMAFLIPAMGYVKAQAKKASTVAFLNSLGLGLEHYYTDFNLFPPSTPDTGINPKPHYLPPIGSSGAVPFNRASLMLSQALTGFSDVNVDGAGPSNTSDGATSTPDPPLGFRTRPAGGANRNIGVGTIHGPYAETGNANWRIIADPNNPKEPTKKGSYTGPANHQVFIDLWGHEVLYYRAVPLTIDGQRRDITSVFGSWRTRPGPLFRSIFVIEDNQNAPDFAVAPQIKVDQPDAAPPAFFKLLGGGSHANSSVSGNLIGSGDIINGRESYILISAGPDGLYFTADDIVHAGK